MENTLLIFGLGYVGAYAAYHALQKGYRVFGTTRTGKLNAEVISAYPDTNFSGVSVISFEDLQTLSDVFQEPITHILVTIPPQNGKDPLLESWQTPMEKLSSLQWLGYLSTTGVYGDHKGAWVDENSLCQPSNPRTKIRLMVEKEWLNSKLPTHIFRLSGIYGPGRNALNTLYEGSAKRVEKSGHFFSRIHIEDIIQTLLSSMKHPHQRAIYNLADDLPSSSREVIEYASHLSGLTLPPLLDYDSANLSGMARSFYQDNRRIRNNKIKQDLGVTLTYPDYRNYFARIAPLFRR